MAFGGRTALVTTLLIIAVYVAFALFRMMRGGRIPLVALIVGDRHPLCRWLAATFAILDLGVFDKMLLRFSSDKGSALARIAMLDLLSHLDWNEILFGPTVSRANALQNQLGLDIRHREFLDRLHRPVRPHSHRADDGGAGGILHDAAAAIEPGGLGVDGF